MGSKLQEIASEENVLDMTPMIDVTFLLLIFFMCTLKFKTLEGKLAAYLPKDVGVNSSDDEPIEKVEVTVRVLAEGTKIKPRKSKSDPAIAWDGSQPGSRFEYDDDRVIQYSIGPRKTQKIDEVREILERIHKADEERPATIDARKGVVYEDVVYVLDAAMDADFKEVTFVGAYE
ncbi:MAG: biopolymer transport protein ExbD [Candidatus Paceibacteria bacterium]|jgi:biopolymer transport protein ExbD